MEVMHYSLLMALTSIVGTSTENFIPTSLRNLACVMR